MSLEENHINIDRLGLGFGDNGRFVVESDNIDTTAEFIGKSGQTTIVFKTPNEQNNSHNFLIRAHDSNILSIASAFNDVNGYENTIIDITEEKVSLKRPLSIVGLIPDSNIDLILGSDEQPFKNIYTKELYVEDFRFFKYNDSLYNQNINTSRVNEFAYIQPFSWFSLENEPDKIFVNGDLIVSNDLYLNGKINCNVDISDYKVNNLNINLYTIGSGLSVTKLTSPTVDSAIINDAWTPIENGKSIFSKRTLVVNGNIYVRENIYEHYQTTTYRYGDYTGENYVEGNNAWSNIEEEDRRGVYIDRPVYIDGDIIASGDLIRTIQSNINIVTPLIPTNVDTINIKDRIVLDDYNTNIYNKENIDIEAANINLKGKIFFEGGSGGLGGMDLLKEVYEHSVVYNSMDVMQKRYTYTGQMPISEGYKHEIGYHITWVVEATSMYIFELRGNIFMSDTIRKRHGGLRIRSDFALSIDPSNNNFDLPGLDEITIFTTNVSSYFIRNLQIGVERKGTRHVKLYFRWETEYQHNEVYNAHINVEGYIPAVLGKNMLFTPFHNVLEGGTGMPSETQPYFARIDNEGEVIIDSNIGAGVVNKLYVGGSEIGPALKVEQSTFNNKTSVAEFWDKNSGLQDAYEDDTFCSIDHYGKPYGVRIGADGITGIGITKEDRNYLDSINAPQLTVKSFDKHRNLMQLNGYYGSSLFDKAGRLTIGSSYTYNDRNNVRDPAVKNYGLDVIGDTIIEGSLSFVHNGMLKSFFNITEDIKETNCNVLSMYLSWITDNDGNIGEDINNIYINAFYQITSFGYIDQYGKNVEHNLNDTFEIIVNPHDNGLDRPNRVTDWSSITIKSNLFTIFKIDVFRQDYNAIRIDLITKTKHNQIVKSKASVDLTVSGDKKLGQFNLQTRDNYFGVIHTIKKTNILKNKYFLVYGTYCFDIFENYVLEDKSLISIKYIELNVDSNVKIEYTSSNIKIKSDLTENKDYKIQLNIYNRDNDLIDNSVIYDITELPKIKLKGDSNINLSNITSNILINLYDYYELSEKYEYSNIKDSIMFKMYDENITKNIFNSYQIVIGPKDIGSNYRIILYYKNYPTISENYDLNFTIY
jgi:hypothetical protein